MKCPDRDRSKMHGCGLKADILGRMSDFHVNVSDAPVTIFPSCSRMNRGEYEIDGSILYRCLSQSGTGKI